MKLLLEWKTLPGMKEPTEEEVATALTDHLRRFQIHVHANRGKMFFGTRVKITKIDVEVLA